MTDFAAYRDEVFGQHAKGYAAREIGDRATEWIDRYLFREPPPLDSEAVSSPWHLRAALVRGIGGDAAWVGQLLRAVELLALGASMHDAIGAERPLAPIAERDLVLLGDILFSRAFLEINRGPAELRWLIENTFRELVLNQFLASSPRKREATSVLHATTVGGSGVLASASVRCGARLAGFDERVSAQAGAVGARLALSAQLAFDLTHPERGVGGFDELNVRSAPMLALRELGGEPADLLPFTRTFREAKSAVAERGIGWLWHARKLGEGLSPSLLAPLQSVERVLEGALLVHAGTAQHAIASR
ncbi:MAG: hypothetical protein ACTHNQ_15385 [Microbacterium sp.]|uniref:hypothetical protein n=1 Tax=Microbacterium sp. TaxID=51671 RepID=UPI003F7DB3B7